MKEIKMEENQHIKLLREINNIPEIEKFKFINPEDTFDLENMFYKRQELIKRFNTLTLEELSEFLKLEKEIAKYIPEIKKRYNLFYEKVIELATKKLQGKIEYFREILSSAIN